MWSGRGRIGRNIGAKRRARVFPLHIREASSRNFDIVVSHGLAQQNKSALVRLLGHVRPLFMTIERPTPRCGSIWQWSICEWSTSRPSFPPREVVVTNAATSFIQGILNEEIT